MTKIFQYLAFALEVGETIPAVLSLIQSGAVTGAGLNSAVSPLLTGLQSVFGINLPAQLVTNVLDAVADAVNEFYHPKAA